MKLRLFLINIFVIFISVVSVSTLLGFFFAKERLRLIDQQIQVAASSLLTSELTSEPLDSMERIVAEILEDEPASFLVLVRDPEGALLFANERAKNILSIGETQEFFPDLSIDRQTYHIEGHEIRFLTLPIPNYFGILQIGLLLDIGNLHWRHISINLYWTIFIALSFLIFGSWVLTRLILAPVRRAKEHLRYFIESLERSDSEETLKKRMKPLLEKYNEHDDFGALIRSAMDLITQFKISTEQAKISSSHLAHEFKTPLTVLRNALELIERQNSLNSQNKSTEYLTMALKEIENLQQNVQRFLDLSRFQLSADSFGELHAIHLEPTIKQMVQGLEIVYGNRARYLQTKDFVVLCVPDLLDQFLRNLIDNAYKHSPKDSPVEISFGNQELIIRTPNSHIPENILKRVGQPFNSADKRGSGLGLAWIKNIADHFRWKLDFSNPDQVRVRFE